MKTMSYRSVCRVLAAMALISVPTLSLAQPCNADLNAVNREISQHEQFYRDVQSDINCGTPQNAAQKMICASAHEQPPLLWRMNRLDDLASVYAYENATKIEVDHKNPPRENGFLAKRDACVDASCLCRLFIEHTNDSLGGESPYYKPDQD